MASQSFNLIGQEEEQELLAFGTRQNRVPTPQSRPNSRMEEMLFRLVNIQEEAIKSQAEANKSWKLKSLNWLNHTRPRTISYHRWLINKLKK